MAPRLRTPLPARTAEGAEGAEHALVAARRGVRCAQPDEREGSEDAQDAQGILFPATKRASPHRTAGHRMTCFWATPVWFGRATLVGSSASRFLTLMLMTEHWRVPLGGAPSTHYISCLQYRTRRRNLRAVCALTMLATVMSFEIWNNDRV